MTDNKKSPVIVVLVAWIIVGLPAGWGVYNTVMNSVKLFREPTIVVRGSAGQK